MNPLAVVLGSTGYIGGRLVPRLLDAGYDVRVLVRHANKLKDVPWAARVDVMIGDLEDVDSLRAGLCRGRRHLLPGALDGPIGPAVL